jgi:hypothetical protein
MADSQPIDVQLPAIPDRIPQPTLQDICQLLGLPSGNVREIHISLSHVTATLYLHDRDGRKIRYGDDAAATIVSIPIR